MYFIDKGTDKEEYESFYGIVLDGFIKKHS